MLTLPPAATNTTTIFEFWWWDLIIITMILHNVNFVNTGGYYDCYLFGVSLH